jgi:hypothetical protein
MLLHRRHARRFCSDRGVVVDFGVMSAAPRSLSAGRVAITL